MNGTPQNSTSVLCWPRKLLSADDLRRHLTSQSELLLLPRTIITPLAVDELKARGVRIQWQEPKAEQAAALASKTWSYAQEKTDALIAPVLQALERDGITLSALDAAGTPATWADTILRAGYQGGIVFCGDPALVCCIANKISGMRAAPVFNGAQVARVKKNWSANLFAIEVPGRTFFELRQILRTIVADALPCPEKIAHTLKELDGHAHR